ncbi:MAG TPA: E3 binding domain-containing protein, partial [Galbitalea sp.]
MAIILRMPEVLANATEAIVSTWVISEGASFVVGDTLAEVETEKALVDLPAEQDGILGRILAQPGDSTRVGAPIAVLIAAGETDADIDALLGAAPRASVPELACPEEVAQRPSRRVEGPVATEPLRLFISPIARIRARENGIDLSSLRGTGPNGRIVRADVEAAITTGAAGPLLVTASPSTSSGTTADSGSTGDSGAGYTAIPHTGMRRAIARRLTESKSTVPHFYLTTECRVDELLALRRQVNESSP